MSLSSPFFSSNHLASIISSGGIVILLFSLIISSCQDHVLFLANPFNRSVVFSFQVLSILSSFPSLFYRSAVKLCHSCSFAISLYRCGFIFFSFVKRLFPCLSTYKVLVMFLVPLAER